MGKYWRLGERYGISITNAVILLAAMADARAVPAMALAAQIIDATIDPTRDRGLR